MTKNQVIATLDGRNDTLRTIDGEYVPEETFLGAQNAMTVIPTRA